MRPAAAALARESEPLEPGRAPLATNTLHKVGREGAGGVPAGCRGRCARYDVPSGPVCSDVLCRPLPSHSLVGEGDEEAGHAGIEEGDGSPPVAEGAYEGQGWRSRVRQREGRLCWAHQGCVGRHGRRLQRLALPQRQLCYHPSLPCRHPSCLHSPACQAVTDMDETHQLPGHTGPPAAPPPQATSQSMPALQEQAGDASW